MTVGAPRGGRVLALCLVALALLAWPLAFVHDATTLHVVCHEHGEVVDLGHAGPSAHEAIDESSRDPRLAAGGERGEDHGHCPFVQLAQPKQALREPFRLVSALPARAVGLVGTSAARHVSVAILSFAPKQSPPA